MENKTLFAFIFGAAAGAITTYFCVKSHFVEKYEQDRAETVEYYRQLEKELEEEFAQKISDDLEKAIPQPGPKVDIFGKSAKKEDDKEQEKYDEIIRKMNYGEYFNSDKADKEAPVEEADKPFIISDEEWDEMNGHEKIWLSFYEDDEIFTDDCDNIVENGVELIGEENLTEFGGFEENILYIRNNTRGCDYMVTLEHCAYSSTIGEE